VQGGGEGKKIQGTNKRKEKAQAKEKKGEEIKPGGISYLYRPRSKPSDVFDTTT
jgi:hypothetical protein